MERRSLVCSKEGHACSPITIICKQDYSLLCNYCSEESEYKHRDDKVPIDALIEEEKLIIEALIADAHNTKEKAISESKLAFEIAQHMGIQKIEVNNSVPEEALNITA